MKIVKLKGGLGNQLFQYSFAKLLQKKYDADVKLDYTAFTSLRNDDVRLPRLNRFNISLAPALDIDLNSVLKLPHKGNSQSNYYRAGILLETIINKKYYFENSRAYINPDSICEYSYFDGYWQSWRYVNEVGDIIRKDLTPIKDLSVKTALLKKKMESEASVFVGVRKGDYATETKHYGKFDADYYLEAMRIIEQKVEKPVYYIFSNDIEWCKANLNWGNRSVIYREKRDQTDDFEELILMASCRHSIIINSTFHWWGASLYSRDDKIVIAPQKWFFDGKPIDIVKKKWLQI